MGKLDRYQNEPGTWVPSAIMAIKELSLLDKHILSEIKFLGCNKNGCFASNAYLADKLQVKTNTVAHSISKLIATGFVDKGKNPRGQRTLKCLFLTESDGVERCGIVSGGKAGPAKQHRSSPSEPDDESNDVLKYNDNQNRVLKYIPEQDSNVLKYNQRCIKIQPNYVFKYINNPEMMYFYTQFQPVLKKDIKNSIKENEKTATVVAPSTNSISNSENQNQNQNQKPEIQNAEYGNTRKQEDKANQPSLQELDFSVSNPTSVGGPTTADATATTDNDKKPRRKRGGTNAITADEFFNMLPAQQRQAAIKTLLTEFIDMRNAKKKPVTLNSAKQFVREFKKYSDVVLGVAIQRTLKGGWQGLFVPEQHNFANAFSSDINAYRDLVEQCILDEDPEEKRNRLLRQKEQEQLDIQEEYRRSQQRQQASAIASEINELPTNKPIVSEQYGVIGMSFYRDSKWVDEYKPGFDASTPRVKHEPDVQPVNRTNVHDVHNASDAPSVPSNSVSAYPKLVSIDANFHSAKPNYEEDAKDMLVAVSEKNENRRQEIERKKKEWLKLINAKIAEMNAEKEKNGEEVEHVF